MFAAFRTALPAKKERKPHTQSTCGVAFRHARTKSTFGDSLRVGPTKKIVVSGHRSNCGFGSWRL